MLVPQNHDPLLLQSGGTAAALIQNKPAITEMFVQRVAAMLDPARAQSAPLTADTLQEFLTNIAIALSPEYRASFGSYETNIPLQHGAQRAKMSYSLTDLIREYQLLRGILIDVLSTLTPEPRTEEWRTIHACIDEAIEQATSAFVEVQQSARDQLAAVLAHDFRGPLTAVHNDLEVLRRVSDKNEQSVSRALRNIGRLDRMLNEMLDASRTRAGERLPIRPDACELVALVREVLDEFMSAAKDRIVLDSPSELRGMWDSERLRQALQNLLSNAIKYGSNDGPITVRIVNPAGRVQLSAHNFGDPIAPEDRDCIFRAYKRAVAVERAGPRGWGLGLFMVQAVAEAHGGTVLIESSEGHGTTFTLDILQDATEVT